MRPSGRVSRGLLTGSRAAGARVLNVLDELKMKILLFGGTFDPPHNGHMNNLRAALALVRPDKAVVMPAGVPPHKAASATPGALRLAMCACFTAASPVVEISDWELCRPGPSYTVDTLEMLAGRYPGADLYLAVGGDMLLSFTHWRRWQEILQRCTLVVESRAPGQDGALRQAARRLTETAGGRVLFAGAVSYPCASSDLRSGRIPRSRWPALLPEPVLRIIEEQGLYRPANAPQPGKEEAP